MIAFKLNLLVFILLIFEFEIFAQQNLTEIIQTSKGPVQGEILQTVRNSITFSSFRGIQYGNAPVGNRRFQVSEEADAWTDVFNATSEGSPCPQISLQANNTYIGDEDCLNLNVYTPLTNFSNINSNDSLLPVMVWIYGGKYLHGSSDMSVYGPDYLIEEGVIVVAMNYRLGALGFLSLNLPNATGNAGLKDQLLALKWVQQNIISFGGNPNSVTIFGISVGGSSVDYHMLSDASNGLFHRSISMSGAALSFTALKSQLSAEHYAFELAEQLDYDVEDKESLLSMLREESAENIVKATAKITSSLRPFGAVPEDETIAGDSVFLSTCFMDQLKSGGFNQVPHMTGFLVYEAIAKLKSLIAFKKAAEHVSNESKLNLADFPDSLIAHINNDTGGTPDRIWDSVINKTMYELIQGVTDVLYITPIDITQQLMQVYIPVYYYRTTVTPKFQLHKTKDGIDIDGAAHGDDLAYLWYMKYQNLPTDPSDSFVITRDRYTRLMTNFAKYSDPTPKGLNDSLLNIYWPVSGSEGLHLEIDRDLSIKERPIDWNVLKIETAYKSAVDELAQCSSFGATLSSVVGWIGGFFNY